MCNFVQRATNTLLFSRHHLLIIAESQWYQQMLGGGWANVHDEGRLAPGQTTWVRSPTPETQRHAQYRHQLIANQPAQRLWNQIIYGYFWFTWNHGDIISITLTNLFRKIAQLLSNGLSDFLQVKLISRISQGKYPRSLWDNSQIIMFLNSLNDIFPRHIQPWHQNQSNYAQSAARGDWPRHFQASDWSDDGHSEPLIGWQ